MSNYPVSFFSKDDSLVLKYTPVNGIEWIIDRFDQRETIKIKGTFNVKHNHLLEKFQSHQQDQFNSAEFIIANKIGDYFKFNRDILQIDYNLFIYKHLRLDFRSFVAPRNISIFKIINNLKPSTVYIGGPHPDSLPEEEFIKLINSIPNEYEIQKYIQARIGSIIRNYIEVPVNAEEKYNNYINKKTAPYPSNFRKSFKNIELFKYQKVLTLLENMLTNEYSYSEKEWQNKILEMMLLIYPKYINIFKETPIRDTYNNKNRNIDFMLIDSTGNIDIVEIKKPFDNCIVTKGKYRDNYIPLRELSGTVMQIEKYIFYLNKWGKKGEDTLTAKYQDKLPDGFTIKITNPSGIIIMGREHELSPAQLQDFEVIKRKFKNIIDIITYDDLISRLKFTIKQLQL